MYKITIEDLENIKKSLEGSNKVLENIVEGSLQKEKNDKVRKVISQNEKSIKLIDDNYLNVSSD
jgi:hypothetical protein